MRWIDINFGKQHVKSYVAHQRSYCLFLQVSEGLILVRDPPLHNRGNFLNSQVELDRRLLDYIVGLDTELNELVDGSVS